jgi:hypothetical protein
MKVKNVVQHVPDSPECDTGGVTRTERFSIWNFGVRISELQFQVWQARPVTSPASPSDLQRGSISVLSVAMWERSLAIPGREIATFFCQGLSLTPLSCPLTVTILMLSH